MKKMRKNAHINKYRVLTIHKPTDEQQNQKSAHQEMSYASFAKEALLLADDREEGFEEQQKRVLEDAAIASFVYEWLLERRQLDRRRLRLLDVGCGAATLIRLLSTVGELNVCGFDEIEQRSWSNNCADEFRKRLFVCGASERTVKRWRRQFARRRNAQRCLIGVHCDALCHAVPQLARAVNAECFVLLPCCPVDADGSRFDERTAGCSLSAHLAKLGERAGFQCEVVRIQRLDPTARNEAVLGVVKRMVADGGDVKK
jgi:hypothetical protein